MMTPMLTVMRIVLRAVMMAGMMIKVQMANSGAAGAAGAAGAGVIAEGAQIMKHLEPTLRWLMLVNAEEWGGIQVLHDSIHQVIGLLKGI